MQKIYPDAAAALEGVLFDGMTIAAGGFGLCGIPERLIDAIVASGVKDLTIASNNAGIDNEGLGKLLRTRQVKKMISSYVGENKEFERQFLAGEIEVEFTPAGNARRADARRRRWNPGLLHQDRRRHPGRRGQGAQGLRRRDLRARARHPRRPAIVKGWKADETGNLMFRKTTRNFNLPAATCGKVCVAEVEEIVRSERSTPIASICPRSTSTG